MQSFSYVAFLSQQAWRYSWRYDLYGVPIQIAEFDGLDADGSWI